MSQYHTNMCVQRHTLWIINISSMYSLAVVRHISCFSVNYIFLWQQLGFNLRIEDTMIFLFFSHDESRVETSRTYSLFTIFRHKPQSSFQHVYLISSFHSTKKYRRDNFVSFPIGFLFSRFHFHSVISNSTCSF